MRDDPTWDFDIPDPVDLGLVEYEPRRENKQNDAHLFHLENPQVYRRLVEMALRVRAKGHRHYSIMTLWGALRYEATISTTGDQYKLNNNWMPYYARRIMAEVPALQGFFRTRKTKGVKDADSE